MKSFLLRKSLLLKYISHFISWIYALVIYGFIGKLFTSHSKSEETLENSFIIGKLRGIRFASKIRAKIKLGIAKSFENSLSINFLNRFVDMLLSGKAKAIGTFLSFVGVSGAVVILAREGTVNAFLMNVEVWLTLGATLVAGVTVISSKKTLAEVIVDSKLLGFLLFDLFGVSRDTFTRREVSSTGYLVPALLGVFVGGLCYFFSPLYYVTLFFVLVIISLVVAFPEIGVVFLFASVPLVNFLRSPSAAIIFLVLLTFVSYFVKLVRGKRIFKLRILDFFVLLFGVFMLMSGIFGTGGSKGALEALISCSILSAYLLTVNLIRSMEWIKRCVYAFIAGGIIAAVAGICQMFVGGFESGWLDANAFSYIRVRITSTFDNPNVFASYLLLLLPFAADGFFGAAKKKEKIIKSFFALLIAFCLLETWSRGAWLGMCVSVIMYLLIYSKRNAPIALLGAVGAFTLIPIFAPNIANRFVSIGNVSDTSIGYRHSVWKSVLNMISENWFCGIGYGQGAFELIYPPFAYSGTLATKHTHSLYLQIVVEMGVVGLLIFVLIIFLFLQCTFEYLFLMKDNDDRGNVIAGISAVVAVLVMGLADYIWYNSRIYLAFWIVIGMTVAQVRIGLDSREKSKEHTKNTMYSAVLDIESGNL